MTTMMTKDKSKNKTDIEGTQNSLQQLKTATEDR